MHLEAPTIVALAKKWEKDIISSMELYKNKLACAHATLINTLDPNVIMLGVDMPNIEQLYDRVPKLWNQWVFANRADIQPGPPYITIRVRFVEQLGYGPHRYYET